jgi:hypothetical protein
MYLCQVFMVLLVALLLPIFDTEGYLAVRHPAVYVL